MTSHRIEDGPRSAIVWECDGCDNLITCEGVDYVLARATVTAMGWVATKLTGRPWRDWCNHCAPNALKAHAEHKELDRQRERDKARNERR